MLCFGEQGGNGLGEWTDIIVDKGRVGFWADSVRPFIISIVVIGDIARVTRRCVDQKVKRVPKRHAVAVGEQLHRISGMQRRVPLGKVVVQTTNRATTTTTAATTPTTTTVFYFSVVHRRQWSIRSAPKILRLVKLSDRRHGLRRGPDGRTQLEPHLRTGQVLSRQEHCERLAKVRKCRRRPHPGWPSICRRGTPVILLIGCRGLDHLETCASAGCQGHARRQRYHGGRGGRARKSTQCRRGGGYQGQVEEGHYGA